MAHRHHDHDQEHNNIDSSLYCSEQHHFDDDDDDEDHLFLEQDMFCDDSELKTLLSKEEQHKRIDDDDDELMERREAVEWILRVNESYSFSALTASLAVNYLHRFLFSLKNNKNKKKQPWLTHLAAVACISLAAKLQETQVPLPIDLQVEDSKYVFEAKSIKKMEILVLSSLEWKMNPATPLSFIDYIIRRLKLKPFLCFHFLKRCDALLLSLLPDSRFIGFLPSVLATATMMHVFNNVEPSLASESQNQILPILEINKEKLEECYNMILEVVSESGFKFKQSKKRNYFGSSSIPSSPSGVIDVSFSSNNDDDDDPSYDSSELLSVSANNDSVSSSPNNNKKKKKPRT